MKFILLIFVGLLLGCSKNCAPPSEPMQKIIKWEWESGFENSGNVYFKDPVIFNDHIIMPAANGNDSGDDLIIINKINGEEQKPWNTPSSLCQHLLGIKTDGDKVFMNTFDGIIYLDPLSNEIIWKHEFNDIEISTYGFYLSPKYLYHSNKIEANGNSILFTDSSQLVRYDLDLGKREILHSAKLSKELEDSPQYFLPSEFTTKEGRDLLIFQLGFLSPIFDLYELPPHLIAIDADTKETIWIDSSICELGAGINFPPIVFGDNVLMIADWSIYSYKAATGELNWRTELIYTKPVSGFLFSGPKIYNEVLYCIDDSGVINAVDANTGSLKYSKISIDNNPVKIGPAPAAQHVLIREGLIFVNSWSKKDFLIFDAASCDLLEKYEDRKYSGENILYDEELDTYFITTQNSVSNFKVET